MRLATFNIANGRSLTDGQCDADRLRIAIGALDADVLAIQEVDRRQPRSGGVDQTAIAASAMGATDSRFAATIDGSPETQWTHASGDGRAGPSYGVSLLSRWPVREWHVLRLRPAPVRSPVYVPGPEGGGGLLLLRDEPRTVLAGVVDGPAGQMTVASSHLSFVPGWNVGQLVRVLRWLRRLPAPRYLLGDLNLPLGAVIAAAAAMGWRALGRRATFPAPNPRIQLDHVLRHPGRGAAPAAVATPAVAVSDHRPLIVDLPTVWI